jgi:DNA-binding NarL/FixJ family response regulator
VLDSLINDIYASAATRDALPRTMARIGAAVGADSAFLFSSHSAVSPDAILLGHQLDGQHIERFARHWSHEDIWALEAGRRQLMRRNTVVIGTDLVAERAQLDSRFYREFGRDAGMHRMLGSVLADGSEDAGIPFTNLCWYRGDGAPNFDRRHTALLTRLLPHLQRMLEIQFALQSSQADASLNAAVLQQRGLVALALARDGRILLDSGATAELARAGVLKLSRANVVALGSHCAPTLADALRMCAASGHPVEILYRIAGAPVLRRALLAPLAGDVPNLLGVAAGPAFALSLEPPTRSGAAALASVRKLYKLTEAEARVAQALVAGHAAADIAREHEVAVSTVRSQIRALFDKCEVSSQRELVRQLAVLLG